MNGSPAELESPSVANQMWNFSLTALISISFFLFHLFLICIAVVDGSLWSLNRDTETLLLESFNTILCELFQQCNFSDHYGFAYNDRKVNELFKF